MDGLGHNFPALANKILTKLAQVVAMRLQTLLEVEYFNEEANNDPFRRT